MDTILLTEVQGLLGKQFAAQANRGCPGLNKVKRCQLIHAAGGNQLNLRKWYFESSQVLNASDVPSRKNLDEIRTGLPSCDDFGRRQSPRKYYDIDFVCIDHYLWDESRAC